MDGQQLYPDAAQRIMALVRQTFGPEGEIMHAYFLGTPNGFTGAKDAFPCVIVDKAAGTFKVGATTTDDITEHVFVHILVDVAIGFGAPDTDNTVKRQLQTYVEGRDPTTGYLLPSSLMYALRKYITLQSPSAVGIATINNDVSISYDSAQRPDWPETREAVIDIEITERQTVLGRS
jgi:hypothetical protein